MVVEWDQKEEWVIEALGLEEEEDSEEEVLD